uniref:Eukaryotic elongation factor 2 lysine methyltransferase n=1 Tax=Bos indicus x Bos taurus TaxID=30522 RepID=A0A4W2FJB4_BOBOX
MAQEERADAARLLRGFERRFLAARALRSFPWQSLEEKLRDSSGSELLLDILQKTCCIVLKRSSPWLGSCGSSPPAGRTSGLLMPTLPSPSATRRRASCSPRSWARLGSRGKRCLVMTRNCFPTKSTRRWRF